MENRNIPYKIYLDEADMPQAWYNLRADMKNKPAPLLNPGTGYFDMTAYVPPTMSCRRALTPLILCSISPRIRISERRHQQVLGILLPSR